MKKYETLKDVIEAVRSGDIDSNKLYVMLDNDASYILYEGSEI